MDSLIVVMYDISYAVNCMTLIHSSVYHFNSDHIFILQALGMTNQKLKIIG